MSSPLVPGEANPGFSAKQANQMYWLTGLAPVATNLVTPLMVFWRMRSLDKTLMVKYNQQVNEVGRQFISGTIGLLSYFGGGELTRGALNAMGWIKAPNQKRGSEQQVGMMLGGTLMLFFGYAIVRPMISTTFICKFLKEEGQEIALNKAQILAVLEKARNQGVRPDSPAEMSVLVDREIAGLAKKSAGNHQTESFPIRQIQQWVDGHLFDADKNPLVGKTAAVATVALASWFSVATAVLYWLNQALSAPKSQKYTEPLTTRPTTPPWSPVAPLVAPSVAPKPPMGSAALPPRSYSPDSLYPYSF
jgi:hypothetical protein